MSYHKGAIKAVKFRGAYYKFDPDFNIQEQLLNPSKLSTESSSE